MRRPKRSVPAPQTRASAAALPDGWQDVYRWLRALTPTAVGAEQLTVEVCRRMNSAQPTWLSRLAPRVQQRFFVAQVVLEQRGILDSWPAGPDTYPPRRDPDGG